MRRAGDSEGGPWEESLRTEVAALESKIRSVLRRTMAEVTDGEFVSVLTVIGSFPGTHTKSECGSKKKGVGD